ncbi:MAG: hypothetical protein ACWA6Y_05435 [Polaromonas sp.]
MPSPLRPAPFFGALLLAAAAGAPAQPICSSDGQPQPVKLLERFINADCDSCWTDPATPQPAANEIALDWVAPGRQGDDAPLSTVATRDAQTRLDALHQKLPEKTLLLSHSVKTLKGSVLRVAHGSPLADYVGASIELKPVTKAARRQRWSAWLALVETLPAGTEGSPVERNLVRNLLQPSWSGRMELSKDEQICFFESRAMNIAPAANPNRLRVIGWIEDEKGRVLAAAQSRCAAP